MKKADVHLINPNLELSDPPDGAQLSLFPMLKTTQISCLPMAEIHGATFLRQFESLRVAIIIDLRPYPFFDLIGLDRSLALDAIHRFARHYVHLPLDLRAPRDQLERWRMREQVMNSLKQLDLLRGQLGNSIVALTNNVTEAETFAQTARSVRSESGEETNVHILR